jgi:hypothetical protein
MHEISAFENIMKVHMHTVWLRMVERLRVKILQCKNRWREIDSQQLYLNYFIKNIC